MNESAEKPARDWRFVGKTCLAVLAIGLAIRLLLAPLLSYPFDITYWGTIIQNAESGNGLYGLSGYFYTPVWGYILNAEGYLLNSLSTLDLFGIRFGDLLGIEALGDVHYSATVTTPVFNMAMKIPLVIVDTIVGYLVYRMVLEDTGDGRKAVMAFALWYLCPVVIYMSGVQAQFDCISAMLALVSIILFRKSHWFLGGAVFMVAALTKFFPAFLIFIFIIYIIRRNGGLKTGAIPFMKAVAGAVIAFLVIYAPAFLDGTAAYSLSFIFGRASDDKPLVSMLLFYLRLVFCVFVILGAAYMYARKSPENADRDFLRYCLLTLSAAGLMSSGPQYCIVFLPLLAYYIVAYDRKMTPWFAIIAFTGLFSALINNSFTLLSMASAYYGWIDPQTVIDLTTWQDNVLFGWRYQSFLIVADETVMTIAMVLNIGFQWAELDKSYKARKLRALLRYLKNFGRHEHESTQ